MGEAKRRKLSRDATNDEIFPGQHGPNRAADQMRAILEAIAEVYGSQFIITVFLAEKDGQAGQLPRFNYGSTGSRADMLAVLRAFIAKQEESGATLDRIADEPMGRA